MRAAPFTVKREQLTFQAADLVSRTAERESRTNGPLIVAELFRRSRMSRATDLSDIHWAAR